MKPVAAHPRLAQCVRVTRTIVTILAVALAAFLGYAHYKVQGGEATSDPALGDLLTWVLLAGAVAESVAFVVVRAAMQRQLLEAWRAKDIGQFCGRWQSRAIVSAALVEGIGFFAGVVYMLTGATLPLAVGGACVLALLLVRPSERQVNVMLETIP